MRPRSCHRALSGARRIVLRHVRSRTSCGPRRLINLANIRVSLLPSGVILSFFLPFPLSLRLSRSTICVLIITLSLRASLTVESDNNYFHRCEARRKASSLLSVVSSRAPTYPAFVSSSFRHSFCLRVSLNFSLSLSPSPSFLSRGCSTSNYLAFRPFLPFLPHPRSLSSFFFTLRKSITPMSATRHNKRCSFLARDTTAR